MNQPETSVWRQFQHKWDELPAADRQWLVLAATLLSLLALWAVAVAPAWRVLAQAPARHALLDQQMQRMQALAQQSQSLQNQPAPATVDTRIALRKSQEQWLPGTAQLNFVDNRATVTLKSAPPEALAQWLLHSRKTARARPVQADLTRNSAGAWDGSLVLTWVVP